MTNAVENTHKGEKIFVSLAFNKNTQQIKLKVRDTGNGISEEE